LITHFNIHNVDLACESTDSQLLNLVIQKLDAYLVKRENPPQIRLLITKEKLKISNIKKNFSWIRSRPLWGDLDENQLRLTDGASTSITHYNDKVIEMFLDHETLTDRYFFMRTFLLIPILELLRCFGFIYVHGALLENNNNRSILILGEGGTGKSTLSASLMLKGWKIVADDNILLKSNDRVCIGYPFEQEISLSQEVLNQMQLEHRGHLEKEKWRIPMKMLPDQIKAPFCTPKEIYVLKKNGVEGFSLLEKSHVFHLLIQENPLLLVQPFLAQLHIQTLEQLLKRATAYNCCLSRETPLDLGKIYKSFMSLTSGSFER